MRQSSRESPTGAGFAVAARTVPYSAYRTSRSTARPRAEALRLPQLPQKRPVFGRRTGRSRCRAPRPVPPSRPQPVPHHPWLAHRLRAAHAVKPLHSDTAAHGVCHPHAANPTAAPALFGGCHAHGVCLRRGKGLPPPSWIAHDGRLLQLLDGLVAGRQRWSSRQRPPPLCRASAPRIGRAPRSAPAPARLVCAGTWYRTHCRDARKCRLQCREQLALELRVYFCLACGAARRCRTFL